MPRPPSLLRQLLARFGIASAVAGVIVAASIVGVNWQIDAKVDGIERVPDLPLDAEPTVAPDAGNWLVVGSDSRAFVDDPDAEAAFGSPEEQGGQRSDTLLVLHVEPDDEKVFVVSFPRDLVVDIPGVGRQKINAAFNYGDAKVVETIQTNFAIPINHYVNVDFASFRGIVDAVGDIPVYFPNPARDWYAAERVNPTGFEVPAGCVRLDGDMALAYVRARYYQELVDGEWLADPTADLGRIERQQDFMRKLAAAAKSAALANPFDANEIANRSLENLQADTALTRADVLGFLDAFREVDPYDPEHVEMVTLPVEAGPAGTSLGSYLELRQPDADLVLERLRTFGALPSAPTSGPTAPPSTPPPDPTAPVTTETTVPPDCT